MPRHGTHSSRLLRRNQTTRSEVSNTDRAIFIEPGHDPSKYAYSLGFTTEHAYPESKGAKHDAAQADLYNLFPAIECANMARDNLPFGETGAAGVDRWIDPQGCFENEPYWSKEPMSRKSSSLGVFEPPDNTKGDVARAVFYFYLVYRDSAEHYDPNFFPFQMEQLLQWHRQDPPDDEEISRTKRIAEIQGNVNPFVVDTGLVAAAFFRASELANETASSAKSVPLSFCQLHYDNKGKDENEGFGLCGSVGTSVRGWTVVLYNGKTGEPYSKPYHLTGAVQDDGTGTGRIWQDAPGIQNGPRDGLALVRPDGSVAELLSYEGRFVATSGPAAGLLSEEIELAETSKTKSTNRLAKSPNGSWHNTTSF